MYKKNTSSWLKHWDFELLDMINLEIAFFISYIWRHKEYLNVYIEKYVRMGLLLIAFDIVVVFFSQNYKNILQRGLGKEIISVIQHVTSVQLFLLLYEYVIKDADSLSRSVFLMSWGLSVVLCLIERILLKHLVRKKITTEKNQSKMLVLTTCDHVEECLNAILGKTYREFVVTGIALLDSDGKCKLDLGYPTIFGTSALMEYARTNVVDEIYIDTYANRMGLKELVSTFLGMGVTVHVGMEFLPQNFPNQFVEKIGESHAVTTTINIASTWEIAIKRLLDIIGAIVGLIFTGIAYVFVAPIIKKQSPGPVFFKQERVGKNGRLFYMYKFRSMYMDAEERKKELMKHNEMKGLMFKMENDPRIIGSEKGPGKGIGNFIRKTSIDELPQFYNILKGDMSLVGTRPPTKGEYEQYDLHHKIRLGMKPGLTGMWQVSGRSDITDFDEVVKLDTEYIENWSIMLDIKIILKTIVIVFDKKGSK